MEQGSRVKIQMIFNAEEHLFNETGWIITKRKYYAMAANFLKEEKKYRCVQNGMNSGNDQVQ